MRALSASALLLLLALACVRVSAATLTLDPGHGGAHLAEHIDWLHDADASLDADAALAALARGEFSALGQRQSNFGYRSGALWFSFEVENRDHPSSDWVLLIDYTLVDHLQLLRIDADGQRHHWDGGDRVAYSQRSLRIPQFNWKQTLRPGERARFLLRVQSESSMQVPLRWISAAELVEQSQQRGLGLGVYFGILLALVSYNLILYIALRDRNYLSYVIYVACVGLMLLSLNGLAFQHLWPDSPDWGNRVVLLSIAAAQASMLHFTCRFLDLRTHVPKGERLIHGMMVLIALSALAAFVLPYGWVVRAQTLFVFPTAAVIYACSIACLSRFPPARHFLVAWSLLLLGIVVYASVSLGWLPKHPLTEYSIHIGSAAEMVLLSFALAYRINLMTAANERSEREARETLEQRVSERTADLDAALQRLESANRRLEDYSRRDGLTGVFNRRSFDYILQRAESQRVETQRGFALLMLDVDHFKSINDRYGHLVGDDCLKHIARIADPLIARGGGQLARYGGEEFSAVIMGISLQDAAALAKQICMEIAACPLTHAGHPIALTVSIGVSMRDPEAGGMALDVVRAADAALYRAKKAGRNRVAIGA